MTDTNRQEGVDRISAAMARFRMLVGRRIIGRLALANVAPMLDVSDLDILTMVPAQRDPQGSGAEISVGDVARRMRVDPSRASRLVAGLVDQGYLVRAVSQEDGRRAVLQRTETGDRIFAEIRRVKLELIADILGDWPEDQVIQFAASFEAFTLGLETRMASEDEALRPGPSLA